MVDGPEHAHAVELGAVDRGPDGLGAGGEDARRVGDARAVLERDTAGVGIERDGAARPQLDAPAGVPGAVGEGQVAGLGLPAQEVLRERRAHVGGAALGGEEHDPARPAGVPV